MTLERNFKVSTSFGTGTVTPRTFCTRRISYSQSEYEKLANLIKKYGCVVSKVSDSIHKDELVTVMYFEIPVAFKEQFLAEEELRSKSVVNTDG